MPIVYGCAIVTIVIEAFYNRSSVNLSMLGVWVDGPGADLGYSGFAVGCPKMRRACCTLTPKIMQAAARKWQDRYLCPCVHVEVNEGNIIAGQAGSRRGRVLITQYRPGSVIAQPI